MPIPNLLKSLFQADSAEVSRLMRRGERKVRRSPHSARQEFNPEMERLKYEILRSSI